MFLDDFLCYPQPQTSSCIRFRCEKRLEDPTQIGLANASASVFDFNLNATAFPAGNVIDTQGQHTILAHGVQGVGDQIRENLLHLSARSANHPTACVLLLYAD